MVPRRAPPAAAGARRPAPVNGRALEALRPEAGGPRALAPLLNRGEEAGAKRRRGSPGSLTACIPRLPARAALKFTRFCLLRPARWEAAGRARMDHGSGIPVLAGRLIAEPAPEAHWNPVLARRGTLARN